MTNQDILNKVKKIHFIGIGGSGMCPMAEILYHEGYEISGSDMNNSDTLERIIRDYKIPVTMGHYPENVLNKELVVYTAAIKKDNPELISAIQHNIPVMERAEMLGAITARYARSVAVAGTHGKTTTTAMIAQTAQGCGLDPTAIIGGKLPLFNGNSRVGKSEIMVCEACEYVDSFLHLNPAISVILNVDSDHLDYFGTLDGVKKSFKKFAQLTSNILVVNGDDQNTLDSINGVDRKVVTFGFNKNNDYYAVITSETENVFESFAIYNNNEKLSDITLKVPGKHNIYNALASFVVSHILGAEPNDIAKNLGKFTGVHRRFEILGKFNDITVADDFAHHPTELRATITSAMNMGFNTVWVVFQPHTYSRTAILFDDFVKVLSLADRVVLSEILAVREENVYNIYSEDLVSKIPNSICFDTFEEIKDYVCTNAKSGDLIITIGGGNIYMCANMIVEELKKI